MKYAKKMLMVPEAEYHALLNAFNTGDYLQQEKAMLDAKISENLQNPNISEDVKAKRHDWFYKERRTLKGMVENRPQKVVIENQGASSNFAPYLGVNTQTKTVETDEPTKLIVPTKNLKENIPKHPLQTPPPQDTAFPLFKTPEHIPSLIHPSLLNDLFNYVSKNKDLFKITAAGKVQSNKNLPIDDSNYKDVLMYLVGKRKETPRGAKFLKDRMLKDQTVKDMVDLTKTMWGSGRRKYSKLIKTLGIPREKKPFKPVIWARL